MTAVLGWGLTNAAMALVLALPAYASARLRRPAITHALWLLVLLRLVAPPMWHVALPSLSAPSAETSTIPETPLDLPPQQPAGVDDDALPATGVVESAVTPVPTLVIDAPPAATPASLAWNWPMAIVTVWGTGAVICVGLAIGRIVRFRRILTLTQPAPNDWRRLAAPIAERMGLRSAPEIRLVPGAVAPLLWAGFGKPALLIPAALADRLDDVRRSALLAHELAHLRRGDHWVRWLEMAVAVIYWWNPAAWLARRELREAEEQLCDAWVVWVLPDARRAYATALVDTVDFLSEARPILPPLASGLGEVRNLERRVVMILRGQAPRQLTRLTLCMGLAAALGLLTLTPSRADDEPPAPPALPTTPAPPPPPDAPAKARERRMDPARAEEADRIRQEMRKLHDAMARLENRLAELEGRPTPRAGGEGRGGEVRGGRTRAATAPSAESIPPVPPQPSHPGQPGHPGPFGRFGGMNPPAGGPGGFGGGAGGAFPGPGPNLERRMEVMQRAIEQLARQMEEMRREVNEQRRGPGADGGERRGPARSGPTQPREERPRSATAG